MSSAIIELPCLGRPFKLGMLYDCRSDRLVPGKYLWGPEVLAKAVKKPQKSCETEVITEDVLSEKALHLDVEAGLKLSFIGGLVKVGGSAKYLDDRKTSKNQARVSLRYKTTSSIEQLNIEQLRTLVECSSFFEDDDATHVVTGVLYGADAFFIFDREVSEVSKQENYHEVLGKMDEIINNLPSIEEIGDDTMLNSEKQEVEKFRCKFYSDWTLKNKPSTFLEAVSTYKELQTTSEGGSSIAMKVWLYPLTKLNSQAQIVVQEIGFKLANGIENIMESLHDFEIQCNDLIKSDICCEIPSLSEKVHIAKRLLLLYRTGLTKELAKLFPAIRSGCTEESKLAEIIDLNHKSPFSTKSIQSWLKELEKEFTMLAKKLQNFKLTGVIDFAFKPGELESIVEESDTVLCFDFNVSRREDGQIQKMKTFTQTKSCDETASFKSWHKVHDMKERMRMQCHLYKEFVESNSNQKCVKYVVTDGHSDMANDIDEVAIISLYEEGSSFVYELPNQPGKPQVNEVTQETIELLWAKPTHGCDNIMSYSITCCSEGNANKVLDTSGIVTTFLVTGLTPETTCTFSVRACTMAGFSKESEVSDKVQTLRPPKNRLAELIVHSCEKIPGKEELELFKLPQFVTMKKGDISKVVVGQPLRKMRSPIPHKVLMVVGATGAGKTTLLNGFANYIMGVEFDDPFRFKLVADEKSGSQANSQTKGITAYTFQPLKDSSLPYELTIIDTPGFGDTEGLDKDRHLVKLIKEFFSVKDGIDQLHGIGFVAQASLARLTPTQQYVFDSILSIFGKNIADNIFLITTFADGERPPVLDAVITAKVPFQDYYKFNNSALFADKSNKFVDMFWQMGKESFEIFLHKFTRVPPQSLTLTREVLNEREHLENAIERFQQQIQVFLTKIEQLKEEQQILKFSEADIIKNKDFTYQVPERRQNLIPIPGNTHVTNCLTCNFTCHDNCAYDNSDDKYKCCAMSVNGGTKNAQCGVCPGKCHWSHHKNTPYKIELYEVIVTKTADDIKKRYDSALSSKADIEAVIARMTDELNELNIIVLDLLQRARQSIERLDEIALRPNPLTDIQYIELLIESEKQQAKPGFLRRIKAYEGVKANAMLVKKIKGKEFEQLGLKQPKQTKSAYEKFKGSIVSWWNKK